MATQEDLQKALGEVNKRIQSGTMTTQEATSGLSNALTNLNSKELTPTIIPSALGSNTLSSNITTEAKTATQITTDQLKTQDEERKRLLESMNKNLGTTGTTPEESLVGAATNRPMVSSEEKLQSTLESSGANAELAKTKEQNIKVGVLQGELDNLSNQQQVEIDNLEKSGVTRGAIEREQTVINRKYASLKAAKTAELGIQTALLNAYSGNYNASRALVSDIVDAYTYDQKQKVDDFDNLFNVYSSWVSNLDKKDQDILSNAREDAKTQLANDRSDAKEKTNLMIEYNAYGAGITLEDTVESAAEKAAKVANVAGAQWIGSADTGYKLVDSTGNVLKTLSSGGTGGLSKTQIDDIAADMSVIAGQTNREEALKLLNQNKGAMILRYGQSGYDQVASEIDRVFPEETEVETSKPNWLQNIFTSKPGSSYVIPSGANKGKTVTLPNTQLTSITSKLFGE
jgi:hypothetical protein